MIGKRVFVAQNFTPRRDSAEITELMCQNFNETRTN